eukprot:TRINITY_DN1517_c2_g1_i1.p1 TRINITY_DN1517_c2_g1~~TRINITY_DN1517_c2_g1_i1.p1  ORF type:complete len:586 (-),score=181.63 TRINITY_DN1517_c2_g1_i1:106-1863(-)
MFALYQADVVPDADAEPDYSSMGLGERIAGDKPLVDKRTFRLRPDASEVLLRSIHPEGHPAAKVWAADSKIGYEAASSWDAFAPSATCSFRLTTAKLPSLEEKFERKRQLQALSDALKRPVEDPAPTGPESPAGPSEGPYQTTGIADRLLGANKDSVSAAAKEDWKNAPTSPSASNAAAAPAVAVDAVPRPMKRAERYFALLMKGQGKREEEDRKQAELDEWERAEGAARKAYEAVLEAEKPPPEPEEIEEKEDSDSDSDSSSEKPASPKAPTADDDSLADSSEEEEEEDFGELTAYDGQMKIELELIVMKAPGEEESEDEEEDEDALLAALDAESEEDAESEASVETPPMDWGDELETLKTEMDKFVDEGGAGAEGDGEGGEGNDIPDNLRVKKLPNMWDANNPEFKLDLCGTHFFLPEAERYAINPSLPPPPPPSLQGRRRLRLKPRLPLEISNGRWRDEHPNIFTPEPWEASDLDRENFEKKMLTLDLYRSCSDGLLGLPPQIRESESRKQQEMFGQLVDKNLKTSRAWQTWRARDQAEREAEEEARKAQEAAEAAERAEKQAKLELEAAAGGGSRRPSIGA